MNPTGPELYCRRDGPRLSVQGVAMRPWSLLRTSLDQCSEIPVLPSFAHAECP